MGVEEERFGADSHETHVPTVDKEKNCIFRVWRGGGEKK
jgi:hypothetical protein